MALQLCGALGPCQAAEEFLQSLLGSISCHVLSLKHPGSASFLLGPEGQHLLQGLEAQFRCVFGTERLARDTLDTDPGEVEMEPVPPPSLTAQSPAPLAPRLRGPGGVCAHGALPFSPGRRTPPRPSRPSLASHMLCGPQKVQAATRRA